MEETISLKEIFETLWKRKWMIVSITLGLTLITAIVSYFVLTPVYKANTQILLQTKNNKEAISYITSSDVLGKAVDQLGIDKTAGQLRQQLTVSNEKNSNNVNLSVKQSDPEEAENIANTVMTVFQEQVGSIVKVNNISVLSKADLDSNPQPVKPNPKLNMAIAFVVGLMVSVGLAFLLEYLDDTIQSEEDVEQILGLPVLGAVTDVNVENRKNYFSQKVNQMMGGKGLDV